MSYQKDFTIFIITNLQANNAITSRTINTQQIKLVVLGSNPSRAPMNFTRALNGQIKHCEETRGSVSSVRIEHVFPVDIADKAWYKGWYYFWGKPTPSKKHIPGTGRFHLTLYKSS